MFPNFKLIHMKNLLKNLFSIFCLFIFCPLIAQTGCGTEMPTVSPSGEGIISKTSSPLPSGANCGKTSTSYNDYFKRPDNYMPYDYYRHNTNPAAYYPNRKEPAKTVVINVVFFGEDDGTGFPYTPTTYSADSGWIDYCLNDIIKHPAQPGCGPIHPIYFSDAGLTFKIHKVYYYKNSAILHANDVPGSYTQNAAIAMNHHLNNNPDAINQLNCIVTQNCGYPGAMGFAHVMTPTGSTFSVPYIATGSNYTQQYYNTNWPGAYLYFRDHLPHEIGHHLDLRHIYGNVFPEHSLYSSAPLDFLDDVFPTAPPQNAFIGCNNLMRAGNSGAADGNALSPLQIGRMHRTLSTTIGLWQDSQTRHYAYGYSEIPYILVENKTWDFTYKSYQDIIIPSGKTLKISCQLEMVPNSKIIVQPGGQLIVDGGLITAAKCGGKDYEGYWQGIIVEGTYDQPQVEAHQGKVVLLNGAIVEFAREAIMPWVYNDWTKTGGIIIATDAVFRNNKRSIQYMEYHNYPNLPSSYEAPNRGRFTNCKFIWDNDCLEVDNRAAVTLNNVKGVQFSGCIFHDKRTNIQASDRARGIYSIDAGYTVAGKATAVINPPHTEYSENNYIVSEFIDLYRGIEIQGSSSYFSNIIDHVKFTNCQIGVYVVGADNPIITRNRFNTVSPLPVGYTSCTGTKLQSSTGFKMEGNQFYNTVGHNSVYSVGSVVYSAGEQTNTVYKNKYDRNKIANQGLMYNRNVHPYIIEGLEYKCNSNTNSFIDFVIDNYNDHDGGVKLAQGTSTNASQNLLTISPSKHIITRDSSHYMNYYWKGTNNKPTQITGSFIPGNNVVIVTESLQTNPCASSFGNIVVHDDKLVELVKKTQMEQERSNLVSQIDGIETPYLQSILEGDAPSLHNQVQNITTSTNTSVNNELLAKSPYLSIELLTELGNVQEQLFPKEWFKQVLNANIEVVEDYKFRLFLMTKTEPFTAVDMADLQNTYTTTKTSRFQIREDLAELKSELAYLDNWLLSNALVNVDENISLEVPTLIDSRNNVTKYAELMDYYFGKRDWNEYEVALLSLENQLLEMPSSRLKTELEDIIFIQNYIRQELNSTGAT